MIRLYVYASAMSFVAAAAAAATATCLFCSALCSVVSISGDCVSVYALKMAHHCISNPRNNAMALFPFSVKSHSRLFRDNFLFSLQQIHIHTRISPELNAWCCLLSFGIQ